MPRKRKQVSYKESTDEEESEWEADEDGPGSSSEEVDFDDDESSLGSKPKRKKRNQPSAAKLKPPPAARGSAATRKAPAKRKPAPKKAALPAAELEAMYDMEDEEEDHLPSAARKTDHGGYAHTNKSRLKISKANRGNVPWNKGKNRSEAAKAKIAAGVRARNRHRLLQKLEKLGMPEDEYNEKMKQIKLVRERLRRAKLVNREGKRNEKVPNKKKAVIKKVNNRRGVAKKRKSVAKADGKSSDTRRAPEKDSEEVTGKASEKDNEDVTGTDDVGKKTTSQPDKIHPALTMFARDIHWTPHPFDSQNSKVSYQNICPVGGPGGLICCSVCTATYSKYMSSTHRDIEEQRTSKVAEELTQLVGFLNTSKSRLGKTVRAAKRKAPPENKKRGSVREDGTATLLSSSE